MGLAKGPYCLACKIYRVGEGGICAATSDGFHVWTDQSADPEVERLTFAAQVNLDLANVRLMALNEARAEVERLRKVVEKIALPAAEGGPVDVYRAQTLARAALEEGKK